jgi:hypothetical protein
VALPGVRPLPDDEWLIFDDAFAGQMAVRDQLLAERPTEVIAMLPDAYEAACEALSDVLSQAYEGAADGATVERRDGVKVRIDYSDPMTTLARLVQSDVIILQKPENSDEHVMTAAALCFPASWSLDQKFGHPLVRIHIPVDDYNEQIATRVQRLFDGVQVGKPMWRFNALWYASPQLHHPLREGSIRPRPKPGGPRWMRSERQVIRRLKKTGAVLFGIHTFLISGDDLQDPHD